MDADGLTGVSYTYQWIRVATDNTETNISMAMASTYTLVTGDLGTTIKVKVSFTDDANNAETLTSVATAVVSAAADTTPPTLTYAEIADAGTQIALGFSKDVQQSNLPPASAITVTADGIAVTVTSVIASAVNENLIAVSPVIRQGQAVVVTYTDPTTGDDTNAFQDIAGNDAASFTTGMNSVPAVTNNSTVPAEVPADWSLKPTGLNTGARFRLLFLSSTRRNALSTDIADYNTFVQTRAAAGHTDIQAYSAGFRAVGCTAAVDARDNTSTTYTTSDKGVPIYWLNGAKAADQYEDFYDGSWDDEANDKNESGTDGPDTSQVANYPRTGCTHDGTEAFGGAASRALGTSRVRLGRPNSSSSGHGPLSSEFNSTGNTSTFPMYGLSGVFQVAAAPSLTSAAIDETGQLIQLQFSENLQSANLPPASAFTVTVGGTAVTVSAVAAGTTPDVLQISVSPPIVQGQAVVVAYADPTTGNDVNAIQNTAGNDAASFTTGMNGVLGVTNTSTVPNAVPADWSLKPTGLTAGSKFRLLFLSSTKRNATATAIATYNTFVQSRAAAGHTDIQAYSAGFRAVGCTADVDARDNTSTTYTTTAKGVPIYWLNGAKAADQYEDFYDGSWDDEVNDKNESGTNGPDTSQSGNYPFTGCKHDGTEDFTIGSGGISAVSVALGGPGFVRIGQPNTSSAGPIQGFQSTTNSNTRPMYGLSAVFQVAAAVVINNPPAFSANTAARSVAENTAAGQNVGAVLTATDADSDTLTYTLEGTDAAFFDLVTTSGSAQIRTKTGVTYNHEAKSSYTVIVKANDSNGGTDTVTVTITVTDVDEPPGRPAAPSVTATAGSTTSLDVTWTAPTNTGPAIASYDLQYREGTSGSFTDGPQDVTGTSAAIASLTAGTSYQVQVRATNAEGDGDWSFAGTGRTGTTVPGAPTLSAAASGNTRIDLTWTAPASTGGSAITGYKIEVSSDGGSNWTDLVANTNSTTTTYSHTGLAAGDTRHYRVSAINTNGAGTPSNVANATTGTTVPGAPTLSAAASGTARINLTWTAPASTGGSAITGYKIEVSSDGGSNWTDLVANTNSTTTTYSHTGLAAGDTRHYRVSAINTNGAGGTSNVANATTGTTVPGAPTSLSATASGTARINLTWTAPASTGGSPITGYKIEVSSDGGSSWSDLVANTNSTTTTYAHTGLSGGTTRHYRVSAINANGAGTPSNVDNATTGSTVPGAPTSLSAAASGTTRINLTWTAPASTGGSPITGYKIEVSSDGGSSWTDLEANTNSTTTTYSHTGLAAGATRHYRVSAINTNGAGTPSNVANATTGTTVPGAPTVLQATASGNTRIDLSWTAPASTGGSAITGYKIEVSSDGGSNWSDLVANTNSTTTTYSHTGLAAGDTRHYRVSAINTHGAGGTSNVANATTGTTVPGAPTVLQATASGNTRIDLSWTAPASDGGSAITGYKIESSPNGTSNWTNLVANTRNTSTTYSDTGLLGGTTRHYRVSAINTNGAGGTSNVANATTAASVPGAPRSLSARESGTARIDLSWTAPASNGGSAITGYRIEVSSDGGSNWTDLVANTNSTTTTYSHTGLAAGTTRHYRLSAINTHGAGATSDVASASTGQRTIRFEADLYTATEGGSAATVAVVLSAAASQTVTIPLTTERLSGAHGGGLLGRAGGREVRGRAGAANVHGDGDGR